MGQLVRYGFVGIVCNVAIYVLYLWINYLGLEPKAAMTVVYIIGLSIGFVGHRKWTFGHRGGATGTAVRYALVHILGYLLNFLILFALVDELGYAHQWVQAGAILVVAGFLFMALNTLCSQKSMAPMRL